MSRIRQFRESFATNLDKFDAPASRASPDAIAHTHIRIPSAPPDLRGDAEDHETVRVVMSL
jgi:hypothetical protein